MRRKRPCRACTHPERTTIDRALVEFGQSPRSLRQRYSDMNRKALARHRDECLKAPVAVVGGES